MTLVAQSDDPASLDRLHDIVTPPPVPWWPPAPGWYVLLAVVVAATAGLLLYGFVRWRENAYRRAALRELNAANSAAAISAILRRTALAIAPRSAVAAPVGRDWPMWLAERSSAPPPPAVAEALADGAYRAADARSDLTALRDYAAGWIRTHRRPKPVSGPSAPEDA